MSKTITIDDDVYKTLRKLKEGPRDSFTKVLRRYVIMPANTAGEILDAMDKLPPPNIDPGLAERFLRERKRRSPRRK